MRENSSVVLVADGLTPDTLDRAIREGDVPELAALAAAFGRSVITTVFPSVTGVAYIPMLTGFHPADAGVPGLRWFDRSRRLPAWLGHSRSYVGTQIRSIDRDLSPDLIPRFASGTIELDGEKEPCAPAELRITGPREAELTLIEGKYHQVRRMFAACGATVLTLHRTAFGSLTLGDLKPGKYRELSVAELGF